VKQDKRKRLEAAGWKVESAAEFLALDDDEAAVIELKLDLPDAVGTVRTRRRLTQSNWRRRCAPANPSGCGELDARKGT
jgi:hypothetical protein